MRSTAHRKDQLYIMWVVCAEAEGLTGVEPFFWPTLLSLPAALTAIWRERTPRQELSLPGWNAAGETSGLLTCSRPASRQVTSELRTSVHLLSFTQFASCSMPGESGQKPEGNGLDQEQHLP